MISTNDVSLNYGNRFLFEKVNIKFIPGNCYGLIGANGAGKSTFLKILSGEITDYSGEVIISKDQRISTLKQEHNAFDNEKVIDTVIAGDTVLSRIMKEIDEIYAKPDFNDEDGIRAGELQEQVEELGGYEAEANASQLLSGLGIEKKEQSKKMSELTGAQKVKVLLAQALFGDPDILLLDEPTNDLDIRAINWLEDFLINYDKTVIVVSHDRHFLNAVCTHIADIDFGKITMFVGNYDFWYESSQLIRKMQKDQKKQAEDKAKELKAFIQRFSANASKSKQATSRRKALEKLDLGSIKASSRKFPYVGFSPEREVGNNILEVENLSKEKNGKLLLNKINFELAKNDKIAFMGNELEITALFEILAGEDKDYKGKFQWGVTTSVAYFPSDNSKYFEGSDLNLLDWLRQYSKEKDESFIRGFLGRMLFSGDEVLKKVSVLSGGEKVRMMLSKIMLSNANILILNTPTAHLDLESIQALNNGVKKFNGNVLFLSYDHEFIETIANRIFKIENGILEKYDMNLEDFLLKDKMT